jgi:hypothetical protein
MPQIEPWQEQLLRYYYGGCLSAEDRKELNERLGWGHDVKMTMMYNAASGLEITCGRGGSLAPLEQRTAFPAAFSERDDEYITNAFQLRRVEEIARQRGYSVAAILYRARHLGCRRPAAYWPALQIATCLNLPLEQVLRREGLERWQLDNGQVLIGACSLVQWFVDEWDALVAGGADEHLLHEVVEGYHDLMAMTTEFERCKYLSAEHVCMNPRAGLQYAHSCTQLQRAGGYEAGENPKCAVRNEPFPEQPLRPPADL